MTGRMKPPEKIIISAAELQAILQHRELVIHSELEGIEYHLSPVWHDAKEPPKENLLCVGIRWYGDMLHFFKYENGKWFRERTSLERGWERIDAPVAYYPIPLPTERSGEDEWDYDTNFKVKPKSSKTVISIIHRPPERSGE